MGRNSGRQCEDDMINTDVKTNYKPEVVSKNEFLNLIDLKIDSETRCRTIKNVDNFEVNWSAMKHFLDQDVVLREHIPIQNWKKEIGGAMTGWTYRGYPLKIIDDTTMWCRFKNWWLKHWRIGTF